MAKKSMTKKTSSNKKSIKTVRKKKAEKKKASRTGRKAEKKKVSRTGRIAEKKKVSRTGRKAEKKKVSRTRIKAQKKFPKKRKISSPHSSEICEIKMKIIIFPKQLLELAKSKIDRKSSLKSLKEAIKIYDIDNTINYKFLNSYKNINSRNFKYIYTLSYQNRKRIIKKYKLKQTYLIQSSQIILFDLINYLINKFQPNSQKSKEHLYKYELKSFERFIIPISEGTNELQYYYFIDIVMKWLKKDSQEKNVKIFLSYFKNFFKVQSNLNDVDKVFYIIFRIDLLFFNNITDYSILKKVGCSIEETFEEKFRKLQIIKKKIKENIDIIEITDKTVLTLKENNLKFKPADYIFGLYSEDEDLVILENIINKTNMSYNYYKMNRFNYFIDEKKMRAFISFINNILSSQVIREYFNKVGVFQNYEFPFKKNSEIFNYLWNKVRFTDLDGETWGITNREGYGIFINRDKGINSNGLGYGAYVITVDHEFLGHFIKYLINSNNQIEAGTATPNESFIDEEDNLKSNQYYDGGDKFEVLLFGGKVDNLTIGGNHFIFNIDNWSLHLNEFQDGFKKNNILKDVSDLMYELILIKKDDLVSILFEGINYSNVTVEKNSQSISLKSSNAFFSQELSMKGYR